MLLFFNFKTCLPILTLPFGVLHKADFMLPAPFCWTRFWLQFNKTWQKIFTMRGKKVVEKQFRACLCFFLFCFCFIFILYLWELSPMMILTKQKRNKSNHINYNCTVSKRFGDGMEILSPNSWWTQKGRKKVNKVHEGWKVQSSEDRRWLRSWRLHSSAFFEHVFMLKKKLSLKWFFFVAVLMFPIEIQMERLGGEESDKCPQHYGTQSVMSWRLKRWQRIRKSSLWEVASLLPCYSRSRFYWLLFFFWVMLRRHDWHHVMEEHAGFMGASDGCPTYKRTQKVWNGTVVVWHSGESLGGCEGEVGRSVGSGWKKGGSEKCKRGKGGVNRIHMNDFFVIYLV